MYSECSLCLHVDKYVPIASYTVTVLHEVNLMPNYTAHSNNEACSVFFANAQSVQGRISLYLYSVKHTWGNAPLNYLPTTATSRTSMHLAAMNNRQQPRARQHTALTSNNPWKGHLVKSVKADLTEWTACPIVA